MGITKSIFELNLTRFCYTINYEDYAGNYLLFIYQRLQAQTMIKYGNVGIPICADWCGTAMCVTGVVPPCALTGVVLPCALTGVVHPCALTGVVPPMCVAFLKHRQVTSVFLKPNFIEYPAIHTNYS